MTIQRLTGREVSMTIHVDGEPPREVGPLTIDNLTIDFERDLGEVSTKFDKVFKDCRVTLKLETPAGEMAGWRALLAGIARKSNEELLKHALRGGLLRHVLYGFQVRVYITRTHTGAWTVRTRAADTSGLVFFSKRWRYRGREEAMARFRWYLDLMVAAAGEDRPVDAPDLFRDITAGPDQTMASVLPAVEFERVKASKALRIAPQEIRLEDV